MTRLAMDSSMKLNFPLTGLFSQMSEEDSADTQVVSKALGKNWNNSVFSTLVPNSLLFMKMFTTIAGKRKRIKVVCTGAELQPGLHEETWSGDNGKSYKRPQRTVSNMAEKKEWDYSKPQEVEEWTSI